MDKKTTGMYGRSLLCGGGILFGMSIGNFIMHYTSSGPSWEPIVLIIMLTLLILGALMLVAAGIFYKKSRGNDSKECNHVQTSP